MLKCFFLQMSQLPYYKAFIILGVTLFSFMTGKSGWVHSRTQGFIPTCCRWADVLRLLYQLPLSCDGWCLGPWAWSFLTSHLMLLLEMIIRWHYIWTPRVCVVWTKDFCYFIRTGFVITMLKLWCIWDCKLLCNMWWWPLNLLQSWLGHELIWNPLRFHVLPGYTGLSLLNRLLWWMIFLLNFV